MNGHVVGNGSGWERANVFTAALRTSGPNVFAIAATNGQGPAAVIITILITYTDGTATTLTSDAAWKTIRAEPPPNFEQTTFDDSTWTSSVNQGLLGVGPWGTIAVGPALDLTQSNWIWTSEVNQNTGTAPVGTRGFRKTILAREQKSAVCAAIAMSACVFPHHSSSTLPAQC